MKKKIKNLCNVYHNIVLFLNNNFFICTSSCHFVMRTMFVYKFITNILLSGHPREMQGILIRSV
jgi:hypothetical protein